VPEEGYAPKVASLDLLEAAQKASKEGYASTAISQNSRQGPKICAKR